MADLSGKIKALDLEVDEAKKVLKRLEAGKWRGVPMSSAPWLSAHPECRPPSQVVPAQDL